MLLYLTKADGFPSSDVPREKGGVRAQGHDARDRETVLGKQPFTRLQEGAFHFGSLLCMGRIAGAEGREVIEETLPGSQKSDVDCSS